MKNIYSRVCLIFLTIVFNAVQAASMVLYALKNVYSYTTPLAGKIGNPIILETWVPQILQIRSTHMNTSKSFLLYELILVNCPIYILYVRQWN